MSRPPAEPVVLIQDPWHAYAARFIEVLADRHGLRTVCFCTDRRERLRQWQTHPILRSDAVAAVYDIERTQLPAFAAHVARGYRVEAVIPFNEPAVLPAVELAQLLGLGWAQPEPMRRACDKFAFKDFLRRQHPQLRINASRRVQSAREVSNARRRPEFARFVLKPNNGFGNRRIAMFDADAPLDSIGTYIDSMRGTPLLMEEFVGGTEYFVNGQIDGAGQVTVYAVFEYVRGPANGRDNLDLETLLVAHRDPRFAPLADYAGQVMRASELRRTPFHLELKVDADGPCLIEIGARLAGLGNALLCGSLHGPGFDPIELAARHYLRPEDAAPAALDWQAYDSATLRYVHGVADRRELVCDLQGVEAVESMPAFDRWVVRLGIGTLIVPTLDCLTMPYSLVLRGPDQATLAAAAQQVRALIRWNVSSGAARRAIAHARRFAARAVRAVRLRTRLLLAPAPSATQPLAAPRLSRLWQRGRSAAESIARSADLRWQLLRAGRRRRLLPSEPADAAARQRREQVLRWADEYIAKPHPRLGRAGAICPFMAPSLELELFDVWEIPNVDGGDLAQVQRAVLDGAHTFLRRHPVGAEKGQFASVALLFPDLREANLPVLDRVHDQLKTHLVTHYDLMAAPFHARSRRPSSSNPDFAVFRAPLPLMVLRHLDERDIRFLYSNERSFRRYHERFGVRYARGEISDEFGNVSRYADARRRYRI